MRAISNLATAQVRKDTPSLIDVKGLGVRRSSLAVRRIPTVVQEKTEAFFAGVIKESEMMLKLGR